MVLIHALQAAGTTGRTPESVTGPINEDHMTLNDAIELGRTAEQYQALRGAHPNVPARFVHGYIKDDAAPSLAQFVCGATGGHEWVYTGSAYGGDDDSYHGEGRVYCARCGADGDA